MSATHTIIPTETGDCGCASTGAADGTSLERTRYFPRQLVGADDLTQDQVYFREKLRRHNRLLHGWGIVCGARVRKLEGCTVAVEPGYLLGPYGDEIVISDEITIDLCHEDLDGFATCVPADPWCSDVRVARPEDQPVYLAVRSRERPVRPVRVPSSGCGCDEGECEHSRTRDGYALAVLDELPDSYVNMRPPARDALECAQGPRTCPACPSDPWIVLADVTLADGEVTGIDCATHRRYVASFGDFYFMCTPSEPPPPPPPPPPALPPVILAHWPPNGVDLASPDTDDERQWRKTWDARKRIEITFDEEMSQDLLAKPDNWLRVWRVSDLFEYIPADRVPLQYDPQANPTLAVAGFTAVYKLGEPEAVGGPIRYLVQIRSGGGVIVAAESPALDLDAEFKGTPISSQTQDTVWDAGWRIGVGRDDWDALVSTGATLPKSGDGTPGGRFLLTFGAPPLA